jgi:hypothetical protein
VGLVLQMHNSIQEALNTAATLSQSYTFTLLLLEGANLTEHHLHAREVTFNHLPNTLKHNTPTDPATISRLVLYELGLSITQSKGIPKVEMATFVRNTLNHTLPELATSIGVLSDLLSIHTN